MPCRWSLRNELRFLLREAGRCRWVKDRNRAATKTLVELNSLRGRHPLQFDRLTADLESEQKIVSWVDLGRQTIPSNLTPVGGSGSEAPQRQSVPGRVCWRTKRPSLCQSCLWTNQVNSPHGGTFFCRGTSPMKINRPRPQWGHGWARMLGPGAAWELGDGENAEVAAGG